MSFSGDFPYSDAETGFQYLRARHYDPATGQFLTRDPIEALTQEPYGYVGGNPLNATDPLGLFRIPGTNICIDIADPNCNSIAEQHPEVAQGIVNFAGGVLEVNPITAFLPLDLEGHGVDPCSGWYDAGKWSMTAVDIAAAGGATRAAAAANKGWLAASSTVGRSSALFGRARYGRQGILNRGPLRVGWGWKAPAQTDVFRVASGKPGSPLHRHWDLF